MALPITQVTKPSTLKNYENGKLPNSVLAKIGVGNARMEVTAARAFRAMFAAARSELGVEIRHVGDYRTFEAQLSLFLSRYKPVSYTQYMNTPSAHRKRWYEAGQYGYNSQYWVKKSNNLATAATPGSSNHGLGLALDIAEEYDSDSSPDPITQQFVNWLSTNAAKYGISAELQSEPWHWRYFAGDSLPKAVLDYEASGQPSPPLSPTPIPGGQVNVQFQTVVLRNGSKGSEVKRLQFILNKVAGQGLTEDGNFGAKTEQAVKNWQNFFKTPGGVDGIVGPLTWESLIEIWLVTA